MRDCVDLANSIKECVNNVLTNNQLTEPVFGTVTSEKPLEITIKQNIILKQNQLILARDVTEYEYDMTVDHELTTPFCRPDPEHGCCSSEDGCCTKCGGESDDCGEGDACLRECSKCLHFHFYRGRFTYTVHNQLLLGEKVILISMDKGQRFVVIDRIGVF